MNKWLGIFKWSVTAVLAVPPLVFLAGPALNGDVEVDGVWMVLVGLLLLPALIYGACVRSKWGIVGIGFLLLLITVRTWFMLQRSDPYNPFSGLIPFVGLVPAVGLALTGAVADLSYRFFGVPSRKNP